MHEYGLLVHRPNRKPVNIGDYVQGIAVKQALALKSWMLIEREEIKDYAGPPLRMVGQGWYCHTDGAWPPAPQLDYLPFGIHINPRSHAQFLKPDSMAALRRLAPIGCRDDITEEFLRKQGVDAYVSACLTVTLRPSPIERRPEAIYLIDASPSALKLLPKSLAGLPVKTRSHLIPQPENRVMSHEELFELAQALLDEYYRSAAVVVTSRLHAVLPSLAMGIPCLWVERRIFDRRLDLARRYARSQIFPRPDRLPKAMGEFTENVLHPMMAGLASHSAEAAQLRITPKIDMGEERTRILAKLAEVTKKYGWT